MYLTLIRERGIGRIGAEDFFAHSGNLHCLVCCLVYEWQAQTSVLEMWARVEARSTMCWQHEGAHVHTLR